MTTFFLRKVTALWVTFLVVGEGSALTTLCKSVDTPMRQGLNPMTLDLHYCKEAQFELNMENGASSFLTLMDRELIFQYKVTDISSNFDYFFDKIIFVDEGNKMEDYKFLSSAASPRILVLHQRTIPGVDGYTRYFILSIMLEEQQNSSTTNRNLASLISVLENKEKTAAFKLNSIFPFDMHMTRYDANEPTKSKSCSGVSPYVFIDLSTPLKLSKYEFAVWRNYPKVAWKVGRIDKSHQDMNYIVNKGAIRFDCKMGRSFGGSDSSGVTRKFEYINFQFNLLFAGLVIGSQTI